MRCAPWGRIKKSDTVYFKNSGEPVKIKAKVGKVLQFSNLNPIKIGEILKKYGKDDGISRGSGEQSFCLDGARKNCSPMPLDDWHKFYELFKNKKYCLLIFLKNPVKIRPFEINKKGFGMMSAWVTIKNIKQISHAPTRKLPRRF